MKRFTNIALLALLILCPTLTRAENVIIRHNIDSLNGLSKVQYFSSNTVGKITDDNTYYTCLNGGKFKSYSESPYSWVVLNLGTSGHEVRTSRINNLKGIRIWFKPIGNASTNIKIALSTDSTSWGDPMSSDEYGQVHADFSKGNYYVKIYNSSSTAYNITKIYYTTEEDNCNCFPYAP